MGKTVLIADAEQATASLVTSVLEGRGHRVARASSGRTTLDLVLTETPELIIVGEQLDDIDGIGLIVKLRSVVRTIKIVFISNQWREADLYQLLTQDYGVNLVIHRPIKPLLFGAQIDSQLNSTKVDLGSSRDQNLGKEHEREAMMALRIRFREALPGRLSMLNDALESAAEQPGNIPVVQEARRLAHNLKGTASSCGFEGVSEVASALEKALVTVQQPDRMSDVNLWDEIELLFGKLEHGQDSPGR
jgi:CheY-like chemotaxis protein